MIAITLDALWWFGQHPQAAFYIIANTALAAFIFCTFWRAQPKSTASAVLEYVYCGTIAVVLFAWRWPVLISPKMLDADEATMIANALKSAIDFVPWRGFDGGTGGPLDSDVLALAAFVGARVDFFSARLIGLLLVAGALCAVYLAIRWSYNANIARVCMAPAVVFFALVRGPNFVHYSSEHLPLFLTGVAMAGAAFIASGRGSAPVRLLVAAISGSSIGCAPFAKLQVLPIAFALFLYLAAAIVDSRSNAKTSVLAELGAAFGGLALPAAFILGAVCLTGEWNDFVISYLLAAIFYVKRGTAVTPTFFFHSDSQYSIFLVGAIFVFLASVSILVLLRARFANISLVGLITSVVLLTSSLFAIEEAHHSFPHYLLLTVLPITWFLANLFAIVYATLPKAAMRTASSAAYVLIFILPALSLAMRDQDVFVRDIALSRKFPEDAVATAIARYVPRGARIAVWGWMAQYYVETGTIIATRESNTYHQIEAGALQQYFRARYMNDILASRPQLVVDAVGPNQFVYRDNARQGIDSFPRLASFVHRNYVLADVVEGVRIFRLRDVKR